MKRERKVLESGDYTNAFFKKRFGANKNAIIVITGPTGSGKTYSAIDICDKHYRVTFNKEFPIENICFSLDEAAELLKSRKLERGELLLLEEMGANLGAGDFQTKVSKTFTYILQSFRSMNIGLVMTLPVFTMLNKSARQLCHMILTTSSINRTEKKCRLIAKELQLNQQSGKQYWKYPRIQGQGPLKSITCDLIGDELAKKYEQKKQDFVYALIEGFKEKSLSPKDKKILYMEARLKDIYYPEITQTEAANKLNIQQNALAAMGSWWEFKEYMDKKYKLGPYAPAPACV